MKAAEVAERGLGETMSAFIAWAARYGVEVDDSRETHGAPLRRGCPGRRPIDPYLPGVDREGLNVHTRMDRPCALSVEADPRRLSP